MHNGTGLMIYLMMQTHSILRDSGYRKKTLSNRSKIVVPDRNSSGNETGKNLFCHG